MFQQQWLSLYNQICPLCDPDNDDDKQFAHIHQECYDKYVALMVLRMEYGLKWDVLERILGSTTF